VAPTFTPAATSAPTATSTLAPTATPAATSTPIPTPTPSYPPGLYVKDVKTEPDQVLNGQNPTFKVTFLNTLGADADISNWYIRIFEPDKRNAFGESSRQPIRIPQGESTFSPPNNWKAAGTPQCRPFQAHISYIDKSSNIQDFINTKSEPFIYYFAVCQ
jgi:hypothetical protein